MPVRLALDYDGMSQEAVEHDAQALLDRFPELKKKYKLEASKTPTCWHIIFPLSEFKTFEEAADVAEYSRCDKNWLALCRRYRVFGIRTGQITRLRGESKAIPHQEKKKYKAPSDEIPSPIKLVLKPQDSQAMKRLVRVSESLDDPTWIYKTEQVLAMNGLSMQLVIGCKDKYQAKRRIKFLEALGISFTPTIKP